MYSPVVNKEMRTVGLRLGESQMNYYEMLEWADAFRSVGIESNDSGLLSLNADLIQDFIRG